MFEKELKVIKQKKDKARVFLKFWQWFKKSKERKIIRETLQEMYRKIAAEYNLPRIPVYVPPKYKIKKLGSARYSKFTTRPKAISVYLFNANQFLDYRKDKPSDMTVNENVLEIFYHEVAHVIELTKHGNPHHDKRFYKTMEEVKNFFA